MLLLSGKMINEVMALIVKNHLFTRNLIRLQHIRNLRTSSYVYCSQQNAKESSQHDRDPAPYFFNPRVQELMKRLTGLNLEKIFRPQPRPVRLNSPRYELMTEAQLKQALEDAKKRAEERLQFPPILKEREPIDQELSYDPELQGYESSKLVCIDISFGNSDKKRTIVVRDPDGTLRQATWEERDRMNQIFFPVHKRKLGMPKMFLKENMEVVLNNEEYEFILDRACLQFEPDSVEFIQVLHQTFDHIDSREKYDVLHSTRHYGPMVFYFAFNKNIDNLLMHFLKNDRVSDAVDAVRLYHLVNPEKSKSAGKVTEESTPLAIVTEYVELDAVKRPKLELVIQTYQELQKSKQQYEESLKQAHGQT